MARWSLSEKSTVIVIDNDITVVKLLWNCDGRIVVWEVAGRVGQLIYLFSLQWTTFSTDFISQIKIIDIQNITAIPILWWKSKNLICRIYQKLQIHNERVVWWKVQPQHEKTIMKDTILPAYLITSLVTSRFIDDGRNFNL